MNADGYGQYNIKKACSVLFFIIWTEAALVPYSLRVQFIDYL